ncbi:MAG: alanine racemase [Chloroflexi bacterium]|nr:alanine racemase [Chloroflexota bacterium]
MIGESKWDLDTPILLLDLDIMQRNVARMTGRFRETGVGWRPHTKAIKTPALAHRLLRAGAFGVTCAKLGEAEVMAASGVQDILIANQIVGRHKIERLVALLGQADVVVAVDDEDNVRELGAAADAAGRELRVVVEVNTGMERAGRQPGEPTLDLARLVADTPGLRFAGVMGWEGHTVKLDPASKQNGVATAVGQLTATADECRKAGLAVDIVSCGGTGTYAYTARLPGVTEIQAGGGIFCDVYYHDMMHVPHEFALTVMTTVTSRPTPTRVICDAGKKTMSSDAAAPRPLVRQPVTSVSLSAEHARIELGEPSDLRVGDRVEWIVGYSDTTTVLHDEIYATCNDRVEAIWPILGRGKLR